MCVCVLKISGLGAWQAEVLVVLVVREGKGGRVLLVLTSGRSVQFMTQHE